MQNLQKVRSFFFIDVEPKQKRNFCRIYNLNPTKNVFFEVNQVIHMSSKLKNLTEYYPIDHFVECTYVEQHDTCEK